MGIRNEKRYSITSQLNRFEISRGRLLRGRANHSATEFGKPFSAIILAFELP
jgi:hypothetical protein